MKFLPLAIFAVLCSFGTSASAQTNFLKNPGFETWTNNLPASWVTDTITAKKSAIAHGGAAALRGRLSAGQLQL